MVNQLITIADAANLVNKSAQTIRRLIKNDNIKSKRKRTPQGFNYMIDKASLLEFFNSIQSAPKEEEVSKPIPDEQIISEVKDEPEVYVLDTDNQNVKEIPSAKHTDAGSATLPPAENQKQSAQPADYTSIIEKLIDQHQSDKERLYSLVEAFQQRVIFLEDQVKQLQAPKKKWWQVWK